MNRYFIENSNTILRNILNKEENLDIVQDFIEAILKIKIKKIVLRPYLGKIVKYLPDEEKYGIVNVRVIDQNEKQFNVGIQILDGFYAQEKILIYGTSIHVNQEEYDDYKEIEDTYTINIIDSKVFSTPKYHKIITFSAEDQNGIMLIKDGLEFHVLQLPDYKEKIPKNNEEQWIHYIKGEDLSTIDKIKNENMYIKKLDELLIDYWKNEKI